MRDHERDGAQAVYGGAVTALANGNWLIAWGGGPGDATLGEVDADGHTRPALRLSKGANDAMTYRAYRHDLSSSPPPPPPPATTSGKTESPPERAGLPPSTRTAPSQRAGGVAVMAGDPRARA